MKKIKVLSIFGTRPEAIKMAPLVKELEKREEFLTVLGVTLCCYKMYCCEGSAILVNGKRWWLPFLY